MKQFNNLDINHRFARNKRYMAAICCNNKASLDYQGISHKTLKFNFNIAVSQHISISVIYKRIITHILKDTVIAMCNILIIRDPKNFIGSQNKSTAIRTMFNQNRDDSEFLGTGNISAICFFLSVAIQNRNCKKQETENRPLHNKQSLNFQSGYYRITTNIIPN